MRTLRQDIESVSQFCDVCFAGLGKVLRMWDITRADGQHMLIPHPPGDKDAVDAVLRKLFEQWQVTRYICVGEAWTVETDDLHEAERVMRVGCDTHPDRVEKIVISAEDYIEGLMTASRTIIRNGKQATLGPLVINLNPAFNTTGRLVGMLPIAGHA